MVAFITFRSVEYLRLTLYAIGISVGGCIPLMGLPGALYYMLVAPVLLLTPLPRIDQIGDGAWPFALYMTVLVPVFLPVAVALARNVLPAFGLPLWVRVAILLYIWALLVAAFVLSGVKKPNVS